MDYRRANKKSNCVASSISSRVRLENVSELSGRDCVERCELGSEEKGKSGLGGY